MVKSKNKGVKKPTVQKNSNGLSTWFVAAAIVIITYLAFSPTLKNEFTNWDDPTYVMDNSLVVNNKIPVKEIFTTPVSLNYHPVTMLTLAWNYQNGKLQPEGYFLTNLIIHLLNTLLVFLFIYRLTKGNLIWAATVAAIFGVHPMHVESVSWISERKDVLYVFFFIAGLITYLNYHESKKIIWYAATLLLCILSCLSKGMAVVFPVILLLIDYYKTQAARISAKNLLNKIPFFIVSLVFGVTAYKIQSGGAIADLQTFTLFQRLMFASYGAIMYVVKFFAPTNLSAFYPYPVLGKDGNVPVIYYLSPVILAGVAVLVYFFLRREKPVVFGLLFYIISVALVLQFVSVGSAIMADRYSYLSYIGLSFPIGYLVSEAWKGKNTVLGSLKYPITVIISFAIATFSYQTYARSQVWGNTETLWTDVISKYPNVETAWKNRGNYYGQNNRIEEAMHDYRMLVKMNSKDSKVYSNLGNVYGLRGKPDSALWAYSKAIELDSQNADSYVNRAITYCMAKQFDKAFPDFAKALSIDPSIYGVYSNRGYAYFATGQYQESINDYTAYLRYRPEDAAAYYYRGLSYRAMGNVTAGETDVQHAIKLGYKVN